MFAVNAKQKTHVVSAWQYPTCIKILLIFACEVSKRDEALRFFHKIWTGNCMFKQIHLCLLFVVLYEKYQ